VVVQVGGGGIDKLGDADAQRSGRRSAAPGSESAGDFVGRDRVRADRVERAPVLRIRGSVGGGRGAARDERDPMPVGVFADVHRRADLWNAVRALVRTLRV